VLLVVGEGWTVEHVGKLAAIDFDVVLSELRRSCLLCEADCSDGRVAEYDGGDVLVTHLQIWLVVEETLGEDSASPDGHGGQLGSSGCHVTEGVDARHICVLELVDENCSTCVHLDASVLEKKGSDVWWATQGCENALSVHVATISQSHPEKTILELGDACERCLGPRIQAKLLHALEEDFDELLVDVGEELVTSQNCGLNSKSLHDLGHLDANVASTEDGDTLG